MRLRCTIGSQKLRDGRTISEGEEYELEDDRTAEILIQAGYAVAVAVRVEPEKEVKKEVEKEVEETEVVKPEKVRKRRE